MGRAFVRSRDKVPSHAVGRAYIITHADIANKRENWKHVKKKVKKGSKIHAGIISFTCAYKSVTRWTIEEEKMRYKNVVF